MNNFTILITALDQLGVKSAKTAKLVASEVYKPVSKVKKAA